MPAVHQLTPDHARRIAVRAQLLGLPRPDDLLDLVRHLTAVQVEPTNAVAPSAEVVCWSRLGTAYRLGDLDEALAGGSVVELRSMLRPAEDIALFTAEMAAWPGTDPSESDLAVADWVEANDGARRDILDKLYDEGPLPGQAFPDTTVLPWRSSGWNGDRNVRVLLERMVARGEVASAGYDGRTRLWDLAERVYPDVEPVPLAEARRVRAERQLRALGLARPRWLGGLGDVGEPAVVARVRGRWRLDPSYLDDQAGRLEPRTVLLSPLDRLVFDRTRMSQLWDFDYQLEQYKPAASRRWGYWALPVLHGADLVAKVDATADRERGVLRVDAVHEGPAAPDDPAWAASVREAVDAQIEALGRWLGLVVERRDAERFT